MLLIIIIFTYLGKFGKVAMAVLVKGKSFVEVEVEAVFVFNAVYA